MKLIGNLLLTVCLITGCLSAATAYMARVDTQNLTEQTLSEPAGAQTPDEMQRAEIESRYAAGELTAEQYVANLEARTPVVSKPAEDLRDEEKRLTEEQIAEARAAKGVEYLHLKEFSVTRWPHAWVFGLSAVGLLAGSLLVRAGDKAHIAKHQDEEAAHAAATSPEAAMKTISEGVTSLKSELPSMPSDDARLQAIITRLGDLQIDSIPTFIDARPKLIARFGLGGYAEIMDRFAAMERKINRSWSAAADGHLGESTTALNDAVAIAPDVSEKL